MTTNKKRKGRRQPSLPSVSILTPERMAKIAGELEEHPVIRDVGAGTAVSAVQIKAPTNTVVPRLDAELVQVCVRFLRDHDKFSNVGSHLVTDYHGAGGGSFGPCSGGVPDGDRESFNTVTLLFSQIDDRFRWILEWLAGAVENQRLGRPLSLKQIGEQIAGYRDDATNRGVGAGAVWGALVRVAEHYRREAVLGSGTASTASEIAARRQIRHERLARDRR